MHELVCFVSAVQIYFMKNSAETIMDKQMGTNCLLTDFELSTVFS